jgi:hypothetical protein
MQCFQEQGQPSLEFIPVEIRNDGLYSLTCNNGHTTLTAIQQQKFEILFDMGAMALLDGYPREAVMSMATSLERFYEFYIKVITLKHQVTDDAYLNTKRNATRSEREFGAFLYLYLIDHKNSCCPIIDNKEPDINGRSKNNTKTWKNFRNEIVHNGYIPSTEEALAYGNLIYQYIYSLIADLKENSSEYIQQAIVTQLNRAHEIDKDLKVATMCIPTLISLSQGDTPPNSLEKALESLVEYRKWLHH